MLNIRKRKAISILSSCMYVFCISSAGNQSVFCTSNGVNNCCNEVIDPLNVGVQIAKSIRPNNTFLELVTDSEGHVKPSIKNLFVLLIDLVDKTNYIWGGGRNEVNGNRIVDSIGLPRIWLSFREKQNCNYNWKKHCKIIHNSEGEELLGVSDEWVPFGTDCSGLMAWLVKNILHEGEDKESEQQPKSYLAKAKTMAKFFSEKGLGVYTNFGEIANIFPGDIVSMNCSYNDKGEKEDESHVYLAFGQFPDGSVLMGDMSGAGTIMIRGTRDSKGSRDSSGKLVSEAIDVAKYCMKKYFPDTYKDFNLELDSPHAKYICSVNNYKLDSKMHWYTKGDNAVISDPEGYQSKSPYEVLSDLFGEEINGAVVTKYLSNGEDRLLEGPSCNLNGKSVHRKRIPHKPNKLVN